jgi:hypothetical protein
LRLKILLPAAFLLFLAAGPAFPEEPRLTLVPRVRLIAVERYSPDYVDRDPSGADQRAEKAFEAFASAMVNSFGSKVVVPGSGSSESLSMDEGALFVRAQISRAEMSVIELARYSMGRRRNFVLTTTGGLEVLDLVTGEVYESRLFTVYAIKEKIGELDSQDHAAIAALFRKNVNELFAELARQLSGSYSPGTMKAVAVDRLSPSQLVIDRGRQAGLSVGESFRYGQSVYLVAQLFDRFAVLEPALLKRPASPLPEVGTELSRIGFNTRRSGGQTRFMLLDASVVKSPFISDENGLSREQLVQWAHDSLGQEAGFCMLPYGSIFPEQESTVLRTGLRALDVEGRRVYPDVFVRVVVTRADLEWRPAGKDTGTLVFNIRLDLYFIDRFSGVVLGGGSKSGSRQESVVSEERYVDIPGTFRLLAKETLLSLCHEIRAVALAGSAKWPIEERTADGGVRLRRSQPSPVSGETIEVLRPVKSIRDRSGQDLGEYAERVGILRVGTEGLGTVIAERSGGVARGDYAVGRIASAASSGIVSLKPVDEAGSLPAGDQAAWLLLSAMVRTGLPTALPEGETATLLRKRGSFQTGEFDRQRGSDTSETLSAARTVTVSTRMRTENVTNTGFDSVGGIVAETSPGGTLKQGLRKTYTVSKTAPKGSIDEVARRNSDWIAASILEEAATAIADQIARAQR